MSIVLLLLKVADRLSIQRRPSISTAYCPSLRQSAAASYDPLPNLTTAPTEADPGHESESHVQIHA